MSSIVSSRLPSRPRHGRAASRAPADGPATSGPVRRFPFLIAALIVVLVAAFALVAVADRDGSDPAPRANPWADPISVPDRVPATPSRGAMGQSR